MAQQANETFDSFLQRLRTQAERCEAGKSTTEWMIVIRIIGGIISHDTRKQLLERERSLEETIKICKSQESIKENLKSYSEGGREEFPIEVKRVVRTQSHRSRQVPDMLCTNCGKPGHYPKEPSCPAFGKQCDECGRLHHFAAVCRSKGQKQRQVSRGSAGPSYSGGRRDEARPAKRVKMIETGSEKSEKDRNLIFCINSSKRRLPFTV